MSKVSIIIPCFNDGKYLAEAVASAKAQTHPDCEIIIVDDHSTDELTKRVLEEMRAGGLKVLETPAGKKGPSAARNAGIAVASGEYILPLDADDKMDPTYVEKAVAVLDSRPEIGICYCHGELFGLKKCVWKHLPYSFEALLVDNMIFVTGLFRKKDWEAVGGYDEHLTFAREDHAFWLKMVANGAGVVQLEERLFFYRIKPKSLTTARADKEKARQSIIGVYQACEQIYKDNTLALLVAAHELKLERDSLHRNVSWKLLSPVFRLETWLRAKVKKAIGRA